MKFNKNGEITITDVYGDTLNVSKGEKGEGGFKGLWFTSVVTVGGQVVAIKVPRSKALKLAWAIIDELEEIG